MTADASPAMTADEILGVALKWQQAGRKVALGSVMECWGSAPLPVGSMIAVRDDGMFAGSVSGGCVEGDVITRAMAIAHGGVPEIMTFGISNPQAWQSGLACGGKIQIYVEPLHSEDKKAC